MNKLIFVFGSNLSGRHGKGAALTARKFHGAEYGVAEGLTGHSYALPTCGHQFEPLSLQTIRLYVERFLSYSYYHPEMPFKVTRVGCGLAYHRDEDIAPMFTTASNNCAFDNLWHPWLGPDHEYWGTY